VTRVSTVTRALAVAAAAGVLVVAPGARAGGPAMTLGASEDAVRSPELVTAKANMALLRLAGFHAVRVSSLWLGGQKAPTAQEQTILGNVVAAAALNGIRVYVAVYNAGSKSTPLSAQDRADFAAYAAAIAKAFPDVKDVIVGNEPNTSEFWLPQFGVAGADAAAGAYEALLAATYDALKAVSPQITVYGGALAPRGLDALAGGLGGHSPTTFLPDLGAAYRASGRTTPIMDALALHPYPDNSSQPPDALHPLSTTIGLADYARLVALLGTAFDGSGQKGSALPILYDGYGVETKPPATKAAAYSGAEPAATKPVDEAAQAVAYRKALELAFCQPTVTGLLLEHTHDEKSLAGWQSGVYYADGTAKTSLEGVRAALASTHGGSVAHCPGLALTPKALQLVFPSGSGLRAPQLGFRLRCDLDCVFRARILKLPQATTALTVTGRLAADTSARIVFPKRKLAKGRYRVAIVLSQPVNPGVAVSRQSPVFRLG